jgi:uncharacterized protein (UPF0548 family)
VLVWSSRDAGQGQHLGQALTYPLVYTFAVTQEDPMQTSWQIRRTAVGQHDGERRWDNAYQLLLHWAMDHDAGSAPALSYDQEASHGNRALRPGLDQPSAAAADD